MRTLAIVILVCIACASHASVPYDAPPGARAEDGFDEGEPRVAATLLVHPNRGDEEGWLRAGVLLELDPGWHAYWHSPGESGLPTTLSWRVEGGEVGAVRWPAPTRFLEADGLFTTYGYEGQVLLEVPVRAADGAELRLEADLLVCETQCIPATFSLHRPLAPGVGRHAAALRALFAQSAAAVPVSPKEAGLSLEVQYSQSAVRPGDGFGGAIAVLGVPGGAAGEGVPADFYPATIEGVELRPQAAQRHPSRGGAAVLPFEGSVDAADTAGADRLVGVVAVPTSDGMQHVALDLPLPRASVGAAVVPRTTPFFAEAAGALSWTALARALLLALLGGIVLNGMPCVLPVLAIKVVGLTELAHRDRRQVLAHGAAYTSGILLSMAVLAGIVIALRAAGASVGWGFQFQEPGFVAGVCALLVVFAANLFGVFEIRFHGGPLAQLGSAAAGTRRSFFEGLLAVVLATPCTAPFLGTAVGFAFASSGAVVLAIFLAIGVGLALPYAAVTLVPGAARLLPRSGSWMLTLRTGLGFALLAAVVWLVGVVGSLLAVDQLVSLLGFLLAVAFATWVYGRLQDGGRSGLRTAAGLSILVFSVAGVGAVRVAPRPEGVPALDLAVRSYDEAAVTDSLREGRAAFVYFTADWCLTCKFNERSVLSRDAVRAEIESLDIAVFRADWTRRDERIRAALARHGKAGVPLYLVYRPDAPTEPELLPELLTTDRLLGALRAAAARSPRHAGT